ncbi:hypothetical protein DL96DRAFT_1686470 [Flagelloscypha sp. PMI_526]|nr:hypothetical protein DL96DRAFT_1686470 [Flagelloscypha sp. PMI_526]
MMSSSPFLAERAPGPQPDACRLLHLPEELFFRVLQVCLIPSILSIRQCCRLTYQCTKDRSVWVHQLSSFLTEMKTEPYGVVPDIDRLSSQDLELLVSRHLRARNHAWRNRGSSLPYSKWQVSGSDEIESVKMLRGGRFLLGCSRETLFLWDIGFQIGRPAKRETLVCSKPIELPPGYESDSTDIWGFRDVDRMLYIAIWISGNWGPGPYFCIYKMDLSTMEKEFHPVSQLLLPKGFRPGSLDNEKLSICRASPPALGVHYYDPSVTITWDSEPPAYFYIIDAMPNFAVVEDTDADDARPFTTKVSTVTVWELPTPSRFGNQLTQHLTDYKPFRTWNLPKGFPGGVSSTVSWDEGLKDATYFDRFKCDEETVTLLRLSITPKYSEFENRLEPEFHAGPTIDLPRSTLGDFQENELLKFCTFADGTRVLYWSVRETSTEAKLVMHFSNVKNEFPPFHVVVGNRHPALDHWLRHSIMISIGRICVLEEGRVEVWELC